MKTQKVLSAILVLLGVLTVFVEPYDITGAILPIILGVYGFFTKKNILN